MRIVLRQDVPKVGEAGTVQKVADGFARNYLIPKGLAVVATPGELKVVAENKRVADRKIERQENQLQSLSDRIQGQKITFNARAGEQGRLFGSVTAGDIAERLSAIVNQEIDRRKVVLEDPIRSTGEHSVTVHLVGKLRPQVTVIVEGLDVPAETAEATTEDTSAEAAPDAVEAEAAPEAVEAEATADEVAAE